MDRRTNKGRPAVSIVVPVYNKAAHLSACLDSILNQTLSDLEVICVDDGSNDASFQIIAEYSRRDKRLRALRQPANAGPGPSRNLGLTHATAPFVQFTDADDVLPLNAIEILRNVALTDGVPMVRGTLGSFTSSVTDAWFDPAQSMPERHRFRLGDEPRLWVPYFHVCYIFAVDFLRRHDLRYPRLRCGEDPVFLASCLAAAPCLSTTSVVCYFYRRPASYTIRSIDEAVDFIRHVGMIRHVYLASGNDRCWTEACESFYINDIRTLIAHVAEAHEHKVTLRDEIRKIWPGIAENDVEIA